MPRKKTPPKHLDDIEALELVYGPPKTILKETQLRQYQLWMTQKIKSLDGILLAAEMGLGKTASCLKAAVELLNEGKIKKVLIIAPLRVAENTWPEEIATWDFSRHLSYRTVTGTLAQRKAAFGFGPVDVTIVNRENLLWLVKYIGFRRWNFDMIIYDEASRLKGGKKRAKAREKDGVKIKGNLTELGVIQFVRERTKHLVALSGTPAPNGLIDLWGPMYAVDQGRRLGASFTAYKQRWFHEDKYKHTVDPRLGAEEEIMAKVEDRMFSLREEDYLELPPLVERDHIVQLPPKARKLYDEFEKTLAVDVLNTWGQQETIEAVNNGVLTGKLLQLANGSLYENARFNEDTESWLPKNAIRVHDEKLHALESIITEAQGQPILLAYSFQFDKEIILKKFPKKVRLFGQEESDKRDWDAGRIPVLLTHPASAGHGLNFQHGSSIACWYGLTWSYELYQQFIKRLQRSGQKADRVLLHRIITGDTIDTAIMPVLRQRKATEDRLKEAVKVRLQEVRNIGQYQQAA